MDLDSREMSVQDIREVLWGGPTRPGLAYIVTELSRSVSELSNTVTQVTTIASEARRDLRDLRRDVDDIAQTLSDLRSIGTKVITFLVLIGIMTLLLDSKIVYETFTGVAVHK